MWNWIVSHSPLFYLTQSVWRDEAFSILAAQRPLAFIFNNLGVEPPLYYILLHFWMKVFGSSEIAVRSLSFLGFALATTVVIFWAEKLFKKHFLSWYLPIFFFFNPMLLYYAFEIRTYGWFLFFAVLALYGYREKKWWIMTIGNVLGFYTHTYMIFVPIAQGIHWLASKRKNQAFQSFLVSAMLMAPWFFRIAKEAGKLKHMWYFPVDLHLMQSVLGNMFVGYEGTPWFLWGFTAYLSLGLLALFLYSLKSKMTRSRNLYFLSMTLLPLAIVIGVSFFKPLFVNRYLIPVTITEIFLVAFAIEAIPNHLVQKLFALCTLLFALGFNVWYPSEHAKVNIRKTLMEVNALRKNSDIIVAASPLVFFESIYYSKSPDRVFLYNPGNIAFPSYVGDALVTPARMIRDFPTYPTRAFLIHEDATFEITYTL